VFQNARHGRTPVLRSVTPPVPRLPVPRQSSRDYVVTFCVCLHRKWLLRVILHSQPYNHPLHQIHPPSPAQLHKQNNVIRILTKQVHRGGHPFPSLPSHPRGHSVPWGQRAPALPGVQRRPCSPSIPANTQTQTQKQTDEDTHTRIRRPRAFEVSENNHMGFPLRDGRADHRSQIT
jgi:hypothetical protein